MIVDTSAVIAIALRKEGWEILYEKAIQASELFMSSGTLQEVLILSFRRGILAEVKALLTHLDLDYIAVDEQLAFRALELYQRYGQGSSHPAQLNYGDCFAVALSSIYQRPLLATEQDFSFSNLEYRH